MKHAFIICAYKESEYLEKCIISLKKQTIKSEIIISTSTPNDYIYGLAEKYRIKLFVKDGKSDIQEDWNYACNITDAEWVTVAHQDDYYNKNYAEKIIEAIKRNPDGIIAFTDYRPIHNNQVYMDINCFFRWLFRLPMKSKILSNINFFKKYFLAFGNAICCPSVTYNKKKINGDIFTSKLKFSLDWDTYVKLSYVKGRFIYVDKPLTYYRIHKDATTTEFVENNTREYEDMYMFRQFWPEFICKILIKVYKIAYKNYIFEGESNES